LILLGNFLAALATVLHVGLNIYLWVIIIRALLSWVQVPALYPLTVVLYRLTEPLLRPLRRLLPPRVLGGVDISPILAAILIVFADSFLVGSLAMHARQLLGGAVRSF
jgi:YggT family protein